VIMHSFRDARMLLGFGGGVEAVSPPEVRADLAAAAAMVVRAAEARICVWV